MAYVTKINGIPVATPFTGGTVSGATNFTGGLSATTIFSGSTNLTTLFNTKVDETDWVDYSSGSTVVGWSSFTTKIIRYKLLGNHLVFFEAEITGTSDATGATFTLPYNLNANAPTTIWTNLGRNNGAYGTKLYRMTSGSNVLDGSNSATSLGSTWTNSGTKAIWISGFYER